MLLFWFTLPNFILDDFLFFIFLKALEQSRQNTLSLKNKFNLFDMLAVDLPPRPEHVYIWNLGMWCRLRCVDQNPRKEMLPSDNGDFTDWAKISSWFGCAEVCNKTCCSTKPPSCRVLFLKTTQCLLFLLLLLVIYLFLNVLF